MLCSSPGSSVHGVFQARILEWVAISFPRASSWPRILTQVYFIGGRFFTDWATKEGLEILVVDISRSIYLNERPFGWLSVPKPDSMELPIGLCWGCVCMHAESLQSCPTLWDPMHCCHQPPLSMRFSREEYCSGLPCSPPGYPKCLSTEEWTKIMWYICLIYKMEHHSDIKKNEVIMPFPAVWMERKWSHLVVSNSLQPHGL